MISPSFVWFVFRLCKSNHSCARICIGGNLIRKYYRGSPPSRIPPRIDPRSPHARTSVVQETGDFLKDRGSAPPAMAQVRLNDLLYRHLPIAFTTLVVKRISIDLYKDRLCTRGARAPLTEVAFASSPTANRTCGRIVLTLATISRWKVKALDISQSFPHPTNLQEKAMQIIIPPPKITIPWGSSFPDAATDLRQMPRSQCGFYRPPPLYGGRDAQTRWFITFSTRLGNAGYRHRKAEVCERSAPVEDLLQDSWLFT